MGAAITATTIGAFAFFCAGSALGSGGFSAWPVASAIALYGALFHYAALADWRRAIERSRERSEPPHAP